MLNGLKLFKADIVDEYTGIQTLWVVVSETYDSAFEMFVEEANSIWDIYYYYFYEIEDKDEIQTFLEYYENLVEGIYEL